MSGTDASSVEPPAAESQTAANGSSEPQAQTEAGTTLSSRTLVLTGLLVLATLVPAAYVGDVVAKGIAEGSGSGGPGVAVILLLITAVILGVVGGIAVAIAKAAPHAYQWVAGGGLVALAAASVWMFATLQEAREGLWVALVTAGVLTAIAAVVTVWSKISG